MKEKDIKTLNLFNNKLAIWLFIFLLFPIFYSLYPVKVEAARFYFEPQEKIIGTEKEFLVNVNIDADNSINTISTSILFSPEVSVVDYTDGNSIINLWVDKPNWDEENHIFNFSGIIPGGFVGNNAKLLALKLKTIKEEGIALISFNHSETKAYLNTDEGIEDSLVLDSLELPLARGKKNFSLEISDNEIPESFLSEIVSDPNIFENQQAVVFSTQDKASGIDKYEIYEHRPLFIKKIWSDLFKAKWQKAESPYLLLDQKLKSYIYIKASDKKGNERIITISPRFPLRWYEDCSIYGIILIIIIIISISLFRFKGNIWIRRKHKK